MRGGSIRMCVLLLIACMLAGLSACGDGGIEETESSAVESQSEAPLPVLELGAYKDLSVPYTLSDITEEMVDRRIRQESQAYAEYEESEEVQVAEGSIVQADVEILLNGSVVRMQEKLIITIDSDSSGYAAQLIGCKKGDTAVIGIKYGDSYESVSLRGKELEYHVVIDALLDRQPFEMSDEWVQENTEYWTVEEYREAVTERMQEEQEEQAELKWKQELQRMVEESSTVNEYPEERLVYYQQLYQQFDEKYVKENGMEWDAYLLEQYYCGTEEEYRTMISQESYRAVKLELILEEIAEREQIRISEKETEDFVQEQYEKYGFSSAQEFQSYFGEEIIQRAARHACIWDWIYDHCRKAS